MATVAVWRIGDGVPEHVIMVSDTPIALYVNGAVQAVAQTSKVTPVTTGYIQRKRYIRPCIPETYAERLAGLKTAYTWIDVIEAGLQALSAEGKA